MASIFSFNKIIQKLKTEAVEDFRMIEDGLVTVPMTKRCTLLIQQPLNLHWNEKQNHFSFHWIRIKPFTED